MYKQLRDYSKPGMNYSDVGSILVLAAIICAYKYYKNLVTHLGNMGMPG